MRRWGALVLRKGESWKGDQERKKSKLALGVVIQEQFHLGNS